MTAYDEALRHLLAADRLMETAEETLFRAELALPIDFLSRRIEDQRSDPVERSAHH